jgi:hypothetical protein
MVRGDLEGDQRSSTTGSHELVEDPGDATDTDRVLRTHADRV